MVLTKLRAHSIGLFICMHRMIEESLSNLVNLSENWPVGPVSKGKKFESKTYQKEGKLFTVTLI
jgi:hypothetical protein